MQLVDFDIHDATYHKGGYSFCGPGIKKKSTKKEIEGEDYAKSKM